MVGTWNTRYGAATLPIVQSGLCAFDDYSNGEPVGRGEVVNSLMCTQTTHLLRYRNCNVDVQIQTSQIDRLS